MKHFSARSVIIVSLIAIAILALGVFVMQNGKNSQKDSENIAEAPEYMYPFLRKNTSEPQQPTELKEQPQEQEETSHKSDEVFVTDVDMNTDHWQTKETEFFTIKFPKEWYWLESDREKTGYYSTVITNNPDFDIDGHADIGIFSGIGPHSPLELLNDTEVVLTNRGTPTSNDGAPQDSLNSIFESAKRNRPSVQCEVLNNKRIPFTAYCSAIYDDSQLQQSYYIINEWISLTFTARTTKDAAIKKEILDVIVENIVLKQSF